MNVQPGLLDPHLEIYASKGEAYCTYKGGVFKYPKFPGEVLNAYQKDFENNIPAVKAIKEDWGITDPMEALKSYLICRYGGLDFFPDLHASGELKPDFHHCPVRANCPHNGVVCAPLAGPGGEISQREQIVLIEIARGKMEKEIADELGIAIITVKKHRQSLFRKTETQSSVQLAAFALMHNLLPND